MATASQSRLPGESRSTLQAIAINVSIEWVGGRLGMVIQLFTSSDLAANMWSISMANALPSATSPNSLR
jgi:hypothetical protein